MNNLRRVAVIVFQDSAESGATLNRHFQVSDEFFGSNQNVANSLMIPLAVVMPQVFLQRSLQATDTNASHLAQALRFDAAHPPFREGIQIGAVGSDMHGLNISRSQQLVERGLVNLVVVSDQVFTNTTNDATALAPTLQSGIKSGRTSLG